jgi:hypothetical protein
VAEEEEMGEPESLEKEEEEESVWLERGLGGRVGNGRRVRGRSREKSEREKIREQLEDSPRAQRKQEIMDMDVEEIEREIERTKKALDDILRRRAEQVGVVVEQDAPPPPKKEEAHGKQAAMDAVSPEYYWNGERAGACVYGL